MSCKQRGDLSDTGVAKVRSFGQLVISEASAGAASGLRGFRFSQMSVIESEDLQAGMRRERAARSMRLPARYQVSILLGYFDTNSAMDHAPTGPIILLPRRKCLTNAIFSRASMRTGMLADTMNLLFIEIHPPIFVQNTFLELGSIDLIIALLTFRTIESVMSTTPAEMLKEGSQTLLVTNLDGHGQARSASIPHSVIDFISWPLIQYSLFPSGPPFQLFPHRLIQYLVCVDLFPQ